MIDGEIGDDAARAVGVLVGLADAGAVAGVGVVAGGGGRIAAGRLGRFERISRAAAIAVAVLDDVANTAGGSAGSRVRRKAEGSRQGIRECNARLGWIASGVGQRENQGGRRAAIDFGRTKDLRYRWGGWQCADRHVHTVALNIRCLCADLNAKIGDVGNRCARRGRGDGSRAKTPPSPVARYSICPQSSAHRETAIPAGCRNV